MPELPEVETVRSGLEPLLRDRRIVGVEIAEPRLRYPVDVRAVKRAARGRRVLRLRRRAKYLLFDLEDDRVLLSHLGMTGRFHVVDPEHEEPDHLHARFLLDDGLELRYIDPRRFGMLAALRAKDLAAHALLKDLGPEPLGEDFDVETLAEPAAGSKRAIKALIMDSQVVVGIGNIYASEALWRAGIHPFRAAGRVSRKRLEALVTEIRAVLGAAIRQGGTTLRDFRNPEGKAGYFRIDLAVYDREGEACKRCETPLKRRVLTNRSTYFCPHCQR